MNVFDLENPEGQIIAFEVGNSLLGRRTACAIVESIPGCRMLTKPKMMSWLRETTFCRFELDGVVFAIEEPFGDNSRYWIGPEATNWVPQITVVRQAFVDAPDMRPWVRLLVFALLSGVLAAIACALRCYPHRR
jgi:hypothetical protein